MHKSNELARMKDTPMPPVGDMCSACPRCGHVIEHYLWGDTEQICGTGEWTDAAEYEVKYCPECGQAIDWEYKPEPEEESWDTLSKAVHGEEYYAIW